MKSHDNEVGREMKLYCYALWTRKWRRNRFPVLFFYKKKNRFRNKSLFQKFRKLTGRIWGKNINNYSYDWIFSFPVSRVYRTCAFGAALLCVNCINVQPIIALLDRFFEQTVRGCPITSNRKKKDIYHFNIITYLYTHNYVKCYMPTAVS